MDIVLSTQSNSASRFASQSSRMTRLEQLANEQSKISSEKEAVETRKARQITVHHANPIKKYNPVVIKHERKVTIPASPKFSVKRNRITDKQDTLRNE